jgi:hypothetical protein
MRTAGVSETGMEDSSMWEAIGILDDPHEDLWKRPLLDELDSFNPRDQI